MNPAWVLFKREFRSYFATPIAFVFIVIFLLLSGALTFYLGDFLERGQADLEPFFRFHPWLYLFLVPAVAMRLWADERKSGTIELLLTLPISIWQAVLAKFAAAWCFIGIALSLTFPIWVTVNILGKPDNGVIFDIIFRANGCFYGKTCCNRIGSDKIHTMGDAYLRETYTPESFQ